MSLVANAAWGALVAEAPAAANAIVAAAPTIHFVGGAVLGVLLYVKLKRNPDRLAPGLQNMDPEELALVISETKEALGLDTNKYNIAFVGSRGSGKSSLVNAFLQVKDSDPNAALVGENETTVEMTPYSWPNEHDHVVFWDLPGGSTPKHPAQTYFKDKTLLAFNCIILVTVNCFSELDLNIAVKAHSVGIPVFFVRNKVDVDIESRRRRLPDPKPTELEIREILRAEYQKNLNDQLKDKSIGAQQVYVVNTRAFLEDSVLKNDELKILEDVADKVSLRAH